MKSRLFIIAEAPPTLSTGGREPSSDYNYSCNFKLRIHANLLIALHQIAYLSAGIEHDLK
jgi:hypothetical protein